MNTYTNEVEMLAKDWFRRCRESQMAHYEYCSILERRHLYFGIPAIVLSTLVGTAVFSSWETAVNDGWGRIVFGMLSMLAAAITALQTFLNLAEKASKHKNSGASYGALRRDLELLKTLPPETEDEMKKQLQVIKLKMDELAANSPGIPSKFKVMIDKRLKSSKHERMFRLDQTK